MPHPELCIDVAQGNDANGNNIWLWNCVKDLDDPSHKNQEFVVESQANGSLNVLRWNKDPLKCLDVTPMGSAGFANVQLWDCNSPPVNNRQFILPDSGTGPFQWALHPEKCLDVSGGVSVPGTNLQVATCSDGSPNQQFTLNAMPGPAPGPTPGPPPAPAPGTLSPECQTYLNGKKFASPEELKAAIDPHGPCTENATAQRLWHPNPKPNIPGATDTTDLSCRFGSPYMFGDDCKCCGWKPHFNWILGTCENDGDGASNGMFCGVPDCAKKPKINYVAAYQFDGSNFVLVDDGSTAGDVGPDGVSGNFNKGTGWEKVKSQYKIGGGDWDRKYSARKADGQDGADGPRGLTPPASLWLISGDDLFYMTFFIMPQVALNSGGCWVNEVDGLEGTYGWPGGGQTGTIMPGNVNQLYLSDNAQVSGCMPIATGAIQANAFRTNLSSPEEFEPYCRAHGEDPLCDPSKESPSWSGGAGSSSRFENYKDEPYVFALVVDYHGYWMYRFRPDPTTGATSWQGVSRYNAGRVLPAKPAKITDPRGLGSDVRGDVKDAVILLPGLKPDNACLRAQPEAMIWSFSSNALGAMAYELNEYQPGGKLEGAQNFWAHYKSTQWDDDYPLSICGVGASKMPKASEYTCNLKDETSEEWSTCQCKMPTTSADEDLAGSGARLETLVV
jgi:hypothetical protein